MAEGLILFSFEKANQFTLKEVHISLSIPVILKDPDPMNKEQLAYYQLTGRNKKFNWKTYAGKSKQRFSISVILMGF